MVLNVVWRLDRESRGEPANSPGGMDVILACVWIDGWVGGTSELSDISVEIS